MSYFDFNDAHEQSSFDLIPKGTLVRVRMTIRPGGFDDASQGWAATTPLATTTKTPSTPQPGKKSTPASTGTP